ncbi:MAG: hypothetical protein ACFCU1_05485 [Sumerlaeia bacterium]
MNLQEGEHDSPISQTPAQHNPPSSPFASLQLWLQAATILLCAGLLIVQFVYYWPTTTDDSYITFRFARNLIAGEGLAFNPNGEFVEGFTNPSWMLLSALSILLKTDPMLATKIAGSGCSLLLLILLNRASAWLRKKEDLWNCAGPFVLTTNPTFAFWSVQGMETPLNTILVFATWIAFFRLLENKGDRRWYFPVLVCCSFFTRVDSLWFMLGIPLLLIPYWGLRREWGRRVAISFATAVGGVLLLTLLRVLIFGELLPNTVYAKTTEVFAGERSLAQLTVFYFNNGIPNPEGVAWGQLIWMNVLLVAVGSVTLWGAWCWRILLLAPLALQLLFILISNGDWMPSLRFFQVILPFIGLGVCLGFSHLAGLIRRGVPRLAFALFSASLFLACAYQGQKVDVVYIFAKDPFWLSRSEGWYTPKQLHAKTQQGWAVALGPITNQLAQEIPDGSSILMSDIGLPGWVMPNVLLIDVDGLTNQHLAFAPNIRPPALLREEYEERYITQLMNGEDAPYYILAFEQHFGNGPNIPGNVYPRPVRFAKNTEPFADYAGVWQGIKAEGDVWNHLYRRNGVEPLSPLECFSRYESALLLSPALGSLLPNYTEFALQAERELLFDAVFLRSLRANAANQKVIYSLLYIAQSTGNAPLALLLEDETHATLRTVGWHTQLLLAYQETGLELEAVRLEQKINTLQGTNSLP